MLAAAPAALAQGGDLSRAPAPPDTVALAAAASDTIGRSERRAAFAIEADAHAGVPLALSAMLGAALSWGRVQRDGSGISNGVLLSAEVGVGGTGVQLMRRWGPRSVSTAVGVSWLRANRRALLPEGGRDFVGIEGRAQFVTLTLRLGVARSTAPDAGRRRTAVTATVGLRF
ncbi:MAG: hypothetical protein MUF21_13955 [Gemmatimonadaceae bacterium]|nr:hypothetical protein [Gemmatimonadaceae bacterium]